MDEADGQVAVRGGPTARASPPASARGLSLGQDEGGLVDLTRADECQCLVAGGADFAVEPAGPRAGISAAVISKGAALTVWTSPSGD